MNDLIFSPAEFVAVLNQTLELSYPVIAVEGELCNFRVSKNRWVYFDLKDEEASVPFFGSTYALPGPLQDGLTVRVVGAPRLHQRFGFKVNVHSIHPVGEGSLKKAADLLQKKLSAEGLFDVERKRLLPDAPQTVGLITAKNSAAAADFLKILDERWGGVEILLADVYVQGDKAPKQIVSAVSYFNQQSPSPEVLVITRGGGSADDLAAFNDERVVRAIAASRVPTLVAIGHEVDVSLAELAADQRASTPSNAAQLLVPDKRHELAHLKSKTSDLKHHLKAAYGNEVLSLQNSRQSLYSLTGSLIKSERERIQAARKLVMLFNPLQALKRGYALVRKGGTHIKSIKEVKIGDELGLQLYDGTIAAKVSKISRN